MSMEPIQKFVERNEELPVSEADDLRMETSKRVKKALKKASKTGESVPVSGVEISDSVRAYRNLQAALSHVENMTGFTGKDLYFAKFEGETVGEAKEGKIIIDPIMLMHPAHRLAHVIVHEYCHGNDVENEGLVEARTRALMQKSGLLVEEGGELKTTEAYDVALANFYEFVEKVADGKDISAVVEDVYQLYYSGNYEAIYEMYEEKCMDGLKSDEERNEAFEFFETVFPELAVKRAGLYSVREI